MCKVRGALKSPNGLFSEPQLSELLSSTPIPVLRTEPGACKMQTYTVPGAIPLAVALLTTCLALEMACAALNSEHLSLVRVLHCPGANVQGLDSFMDDLFPTHQLITNLLYKKQGTHLPHKKMPPTVRGSAMHLWSSGSTRETSGLVIVVYQLAL